MNMKELMERARGAKSPEELLALAKELGVEMTAAEAEETFSLLHKKGELADNELENVAGGGCDTTVDGKDYRVVTSGLTCINGQYAYYRDKNAQYLNTSNMDLRSTWAMFGEYGMCGQCRWLEFKGVIGYCGKSGS